MSVPTLRPPGQDAAVGPDDRPSGRRLLALSLAALLAFVLFTVAMTWPLARQPDRRLVSWGDPVFQAWTLAWDVHAWTTDPLHVFDANIFYPYRDTLAYSDHLFGQAALMFPVLLRAGTVVLADNLSVFIALALSGFAAYLLVVDLTGNVFAGMVAGAAYAFAPARMAQIEHLHLLSAEWLPLALLAAIRSYRRGGWRWPVALGVFVVLQGLFGVYYLYFAAVMLVFVVATYLPAHRTRAALAATGRMVACCVVAAALLLPTLLPYEQVNRDVGAQRGPAEVAKWSAVWGDYLAVGPQNRLWGPKVAARYHRDLERDLFPGATCLALAIVGLFNRRHRWERWLLLTIAAGSLLLSFGLTWRIAGLNIPSPYNLFYDLLPGFKAIRVPARLALLGLIGLSGLAGLGVDLLLRQLCRLSFSALLRLGVAVVVTAALGLGVLAEDSTRLAVAAPLPVTLAEAKSPGYTWMAAHPAPAIELPMGDGIIASAWPNYWSTLHWNSLVNGYSGFAPPAYYVFRDRMQGFPSADSIHLLQGIGVRTVMYHLPSGSDPSRDPVLTRIATFPQLTQQVGGPDYVFTLVADPWLWNLASAVPSSQAVDLPDLGADPATFGMLGAILQRTGHTVYGRGTLQQWQLQPAPASVCYGVRATGAPNPSGRYLGAVTVTTAGGLTLYRLVGCGAG